jgi:hypothetical protein
MAVRLFTVRAPIAGTVVEVAVDLERNVPGG